MRALVALLLLLLSLCNAEIWSGVWIQDSARNAGLEMWLCQFGSTIKGRYKRTIPEQGSKAPFGSISMTIIHERAADGDFYYPYSTHSKSCEDDSLVWELSGDGNNIYGYYDHDPEKHWNAIRVENASLELSDCRHCCETSTCAASKPTSVNSANTLSLVLALLLFGTISA